MERPPSPDALRASTSPRSRGAVTLPKSALGSRHAGLDPFLGGLVRWRIHAFRRIADDIHDLRLVLLLVEAIGAVGGVLDTLVAVAERHAHPAARAIVLDALEGLHHLIRGRFGAALCSLGLFPCHLQAQDRQRHLV